MSTRTHGACVVLMAALLMVAASAHGAGDIGLTVGTATSTGEWQTVELGRAYASMVVVCTPAYSTAEPACVVRVRDAGGSSFEFLVDRADASGGAVAGIAIHYMAVEEGVYTAAQDGATMEAAKFTSTVTDRSGSWSGQARTYANAYAQPVVLGQVMTATDPDWSVFWCRGSKITNPPNGTLRVGKHVGEDPDTARADEVIGYVVIEAGSGTLANRGYTAGLGADSVRGIDNGPPFSYSLSGLASATVAIATQAGMDGGNGGWALLYGADPVSTTRLDLCADEDQADDAERKHTTEQVGYIVLEQPAQDPLDIAAVDIVAPADPGAAPKFGKIELLVSLDNVAATKPYEPDPARGGLDLSATFTGPSGAWTIPGFYDGAAWRIRFAPDTAGSWTFTVSATDPGGSDTWNGGSFTCVTGDPTHHGWPRIQGSTLRYSDGATVFAVGHNNGWQYEGDGIETPSFADMAASGESLLSFWLATPWAQPSWASPEQPWWSTRAPIENTEQGIGNYNQGACAYLDGVVARAEGAGVCLLPTIWTHAQLRGSGHPWGAGNWDNNAYSTVCSAADFFQTGSSEQWRYQRNFYRYLIARWGYSRAIAGWVAVCEIDGSSGYFANPGEAEDWCVAVRDYFRTNDPFRRNAGGQSPLAASRLNSAWWDAGFDLRTTDNYAQPTNDVEVAAAIGGDTATMRASGKPCFHAEFGGDTVSGASQPTHLHNGIWAAAGAGAALSPLVWCDGGNFPMLTGAMQDHLAILGEFMAAVDYLDDTDLEPAAPGINDSNCRGWGMKLANRGFAWLQNKTTTIGGQTLSIADVDPGTYQIRWFDTWTDGEAPVHVDGPISVGGDRLLAVLIPATGQDDIACTFEPLLNNPPQITSTPVTDATEDALYAYDVEATDPDVGDTLTFSLVTAPAGMSIDAATGLIEWTPTNAQVGDNAVEVKVEDTAGSPDTQAFSIAVANTNDPPQITSAPVTTATEDALYSYDVAATDPDVGDTLTFSLVVAPAGMGIQPATGLIEWTPTNEQVGDNAVEVKVEDAIGASDTQAFTIAVANANDPPQITSAPVTSATEDAPYTYDVEATDPDVGDTLTFSLLTAPDGMTIDAATGLIEWTPTNEQVGDNAVEVEVEDTAGASDTQPFSIAVANTNDPPEITSAPVTTGVVDILYVYDVEAADPDAGDTLTFSLPVAPEGMAIDPATGTIEWTPTSEQAGDNNVTVKAQDAAGASDTQAFVITVASANHPPQITSTPVTAATEDALYTYAVEATDPDPGDTLAFSLLIAPGGMTINAATGLIEWTPSNEQVGDNAVEVQVEDAVGATDTQAFSIAVANTNDPPQITSAPVIAATEDALYSYDVDATDPDAGDSLTFSLLLAPAGMTIDPATGLILWTPTNAQVGDNAVEVQVEDAAGATDAQPFSITVANTNDPPQITSTPLTTATEDAPYTYDVAATDPDAGDTLTFSLLTAPAGMAINATTGVIQWTPTNAQVGENAVEVQVEDAVGATDTQAFSIAVANTNDPPAITSAPVTTGKEDELYTYDVEASDPDAGDTLTFSLVTAPPGMTIDAATGLIEWTPTNAQVGDSDVSVKVQDAAGASDTQLFTIAVAPAGLTAVVSIDLSIQAFWKWWRVTTTVTVADPSGAPIVGATVEGHWSGVVTGNVSDTTDAAGQIDNRTGWIRSSGTATFTVDRVSKDGQDYTLTGETSDSTNH